METTKNLKLPQYTGEDIFDLQDINKAYDSIDKAYGNLDDTYRKVANIKNEITKTNATAEVIDARGNKETLGKRLDEFGSQQVKLTNDIETINSQMETKVNRDFYEVVFKNTSPLEIDTEKLQEVIYTIISYLCKKIKEDSVYGISRRR